jgi:XTP/dITP diphosphohydrolase
VIADDSGLEVACLQGAPGVRSARYAEDQRFPHPPAATLDERNNAALLRALDGVPDQCRQASYRCVLALARDGKVLRSAEGTLDGSILLAPRGDAGFGYDPLFLLPEYGVTMAEVDPVIRIQVSHRGRALENLLRQLAPA